MVSKTERKAPRGERGKQRKEFVQAKFSKRGYGINGKQPVYYRVNTKDKDNLTKKQSRVYRE